MRRCDAELAALEKAMDAATRQRGRTLALAQLIESAAQRSPLLLIVEDVHWADTDELARLGEIAAVVANCQILLIMTTRPEGDPISATWRARARGCPVTTVDSRRSPTTRRKNSLRTIPSCRARP